MHWDDWIYRGIWHLSDSIVLGYPPIPMSTSPLLIASKAQIHTYFIPRHAPHVHFVLSGTPRGGFSGGPAITENGDALGLITSSLLENGHPPELGYLTIISVEAIFKLLESFNMVPDVQKAYHSDLLNSLLPKRNP
jgi:hypothetical protein